MTIYVCSFSLSLLLAYIFRLIKGHKREDSKLFWKNKKKEIAIIATILWFVMGCRGNMVGSDTLNYSNIFVDIATQGPFSHMMFKRAPVYALYNTFIGIFSKSPQWVVMCNSAIILGCISYVIYKESDEVIGSWFVYVTLHYYFYAMNAARQSMAIAMSMVVFSLLRQRKNKKAFIVAVSAVLTHSSAAISLVLFPIMLLKDKKKFYCLFLVSLVAFVSLFNHLMVIFIKIFPEYQSYLNSAFVKSLGESAGGRTITALYMLIVIVISFLLYKIGKIKQADKEKFFQLLYLVSVAIIPMILMRKSNISYRIEMYFIEYSILLIPFVFKRLPSKWHSGLISMLGYSVLLYPYITKMPDYIPFLFFWQKK